MWHRADNHAPARATTGAPQTGDPLTAVAGPDDFPKIASPNTHGIIWRRKIPASVSDALGALSAEHLPTARIVLARQDIQHTVEHLLTESSAIPAQARDWLIADTIQLATAFATALNASKLRLRFDVICDDGCPKFHQDAVPARLLCTYRGPGTQYGMVTGTEQREPTTIFTAPTGAPVILRGKQWPTSDAHILRHRSPPAKETARKTARETQSPRLLLALDPLSNAAE